MEKRPNDNAKEHLLAAVREATLATYGDRLVAVAVFGSWARGTATSASDLDLLVVAEPLPPSRMKRVREFLPVTEVTRPVRSRVWPKDGADVELSPVFKTPAELAAGYHRKCVDRLAALEVLHARGACSNVLRESEELVELALKGMLRWAGIDPPRIHDVGDLLLQFAERFANVSDGELAARAQASKVLRKKREFSFYGDIDFIPTDEYDAEDSDVALAQARLAAECLGRLLGARKTN